MSEKHVQLPNLSSIIRKPAAAVTADLLRYDGGSWVRLAAVSTAGHYLRVVNATTLGWQDLEDHVHQDIPGAGGLIDHAYLSNVLVNQHHNETHQLSGAKHTDSGLTAGQVPRASASTAFAWQTLAHTDLTTVGANDHHNQAHDLTGADHTDSGLTAGHYLRATNATQFAFAAIAAADEPIAPPYFLAPPWGVNANIGVNLATAGTVWFVPAKSIIDGTITKLGGAVQTTVAAGIIMMGLYDDASGKPGNLLGATASTNAMGANFNEYNLTANVNVTHDNWYWIGVMPDTTAAGTAALRGSVANWNLGGTYASKRVANAGGWGTFDATAATTPTAAGAPDLVGLMP